ncbi:hypothetical protein MTR_5g034000 [Medicago truncatula]|uniref:Uncharacterized protein n=1 Tax=Medicago truncatula TaxID=3880 RepID=G7K083_MEDTR|nr:hypothetical protein MTR_5g034000 [Medicago truncatula]
MERQARLQAEEDLKKSEELCERAKMAQNNYEKSLMEIKKNSLGERESIVELKMNNNELELEVSENEKNASEVKNSELEKSLKICEALADAGITAFQEKEIVDATPLQIIEPPMKRSKDDQGA